MNTPGGFPALPVNRSTTYRRNLTEPGEISERPPTPAIRTRSYLPNNSNTLQPLEILPTLQPLPSTNTPSLFLHYQPESETFRADFTNRPEPSNTLNDSLSPLSETFEGPSTTPDSEQENRPPRPQHTRNRRIHALPGLVDVIEDRLIDCEEDVRYLTQRLDDRRPRDSYTWSNLAQHAETLDRLTASIHQHQLRFDLLINLCAGYEIKILELQTHITDLRTNLALITPEVATLISHDHHRGRPLHPENPFSAQNNPFAPHNRPPLQDLPIPSAVDIILDHGSQQPPSSSNPDGRRSPSPPERLPERVDEISRQGSTLPTDIHMDDTQPQ